MTNLKYLAVALLVAWGGGAQAALTSTGTDCDVASVGGATACAGIFDGNDSNQTLDGLFGVPEWTEILKLDSGSGVEESNGIRLDVTDSSWEVDGYAGNDPVMFVLKGGRSFSAFLMDTTVSSGNWDTDSLLKGNGDVGAGLSHWTVYGGTVAIPVPAALPLLLLGVGALGYMAHRRRNQAA